MISCRRFYQAIKGKFYLKPVKWINQLLSFRYLKNKKVIFFEIPDYPELAVKRVWPLVKENKDLLIYFPDLKPSQLPEKEFLYGIFCTLMQDEVRELIANILKNRSLAAQDNKEDRADVTQEFKELLLSLYAMKSKYSSCFTLT